MHVSLVSLSAIAILAAPAAFAQKCVEAPFTEVYEHGGQVDWSLDVDGCGFTSSLTGDSTSAATVHTVRRDVSEPLRMSFRVDLAELDGMNILQSVSLASAVSQTVVGSDSAAQADVFRVGVRGSVGNRTLFVLAACGDCASNLAVTNLPLDSDRPEIGLELDLGAGSDGELRVWIDAGFTGPPSAVLADLDNAAWHGTYRLILGASSPSPNFSFVQAGRPLRFDRIGLGDSQLVWRNFEADGESCEAPQLWPQSTTAGDTCGAEYLLSTLAAGSTSTRAPTHIYSLVVPYAKWQGELSLDSESGMAAFVCWEFCGPAVRCMGAATPGQPLVWHGALPGELRVIVTAQLPGQCGPYTLELSGTLD